MTDFSSNPWRCSAEVDASGLLTQANNWTVIQTFQNGINLTGLLSPPSVTNVAGYTQAIITIRTLGTTGTVTCFSSFQLDEKTFIANNSSITINTTEDNNVELTAQWNIVHAENTATIDQGFLEAMN